MAKRRPKLTNAIARDLVVRLEKTHRAINAKLQRELDAILSSMNADLNAPAAPEESGE